MWEDGHYTWTVMPQDYNKSSTYFLKYLKLIWTDVHVTNDSALIQYVDNLVLCSGTE